MTNQNEKGLAIIQQLAELLGVDMKETNIAIAPPHGTAKVMSADGVLGAKIIWEDTVRVSAKRSLGIYIQLVDHRRMLAPKEAIYMLSAYMPDAPESDDGSGVTLNGDIFSSYIGKDGLLLDEAACERAMKLYPTKIREK